MSAYHRTRLWFRAVFLRGRQDRDLAREIATHIEMEREHLMRQGIPRTEAERLAHVAFGGVQRYVEAVRDMRGARPFGGFTQDVRYALRYFARAPLVSIVIIVLLAIGIGVNSAVFALLDTFAFAPPAGVPRDPALVRIRGTVVYDGATRSRPISADEVRDYAKMNGIFAAVAGAASARLPIVPASGEGETGQVQFVTSGFMGVLGVRPVLGSLLPADDDRASGGAAAVVLSYRFWRVAFGASPAVIGQPIDIGGVSGVIIGVATQGFDGVGAPYSGWTSAWLPIWSYTGATSTRKKNAAHFFDDGVLNVVARLTPGTSLARANAAVRGVGSAALQTNQRDSHTRSTGSEVIALRAGNATRDVPKGQYSAIALLGIVTFLVLAIICSTVTMLIVSRAVMRQREIGVRLSLGATRARLVRQLMTESAMLALAGGAGGMALVAVFARLAAMWRPDNPITFGTWTIGATALFTLGTAFLFGLSPALHATRSSVSQSLKESTGISTWHTLAHRQLIVAQIALSQPLLVGVAALISNAIESRGPDVNAAEAAQTLVVQLELPGGGKDSDRVRDVALVERIAADVRALPAVSHVAITEPGEHRNKYHTAPGEPAVSPQSFAASTHSVSDTYFALHDAHVIRGRNFANSDVVGSPLAVIVGSDLATQLWGAADPSGRHLVNECECAGGTYTVIGVVDAREMGSSTVDGRVQVYSAFLQEPSPWYAALWIRSAANPDAIAQSVRARIRASAPDLAIPRIGVSAVSAEHWLRQRSALYASAAGLAALFLAAIGLYAVVSFSVRQRTRDIAVRLAMGARPAQVSRQFLTNALKLCAIGCGFGLPISIFAVRALFSMFAAREFNAFIVANVIAAAVTLVALLAAWLPARGAARVDPMSALRAE